MLSEHHNKFMRASTAFKTHTEITQHLRSCGHSLSGAMQAPSYVSVGILLAIPSRFGSVHERSLDLKLMLKSIL